MVDLRTSPSAVLRRLPYWLYSVQTRGRRWRKDRRIVEILAPRRMLHEAPDDAGTGDGVDSPNHPRRPKPGSRRRRHAMQAFVHGIARHPESGHRDLDVRSAWQIQKGYVREGGIPAVRRASGRRLQVIDIPRSCLSSDETEVVPCPYGEFKLWSPPTHR